MAAFRKVLIANRGEIAVRIIRACRELGIGTVAIASSADADAVHARLADEVYEAGGPKAAESYLNLDRILEIAKESGAEAVHPGYGFFAENAAAAQRIIDAGLVFIGPRPDAIELMGDKVRAREAARGAGVTVSGGTGSLSDPDAIRSIAREVGFPVILKPTAGGGGIGMQIAEDEAGLDKALQTAQRLAKASFGNADVYLEKYLPNARHIEIQLLGDAHGNVTHLNERECSVQRRYQKLVEESPSVALTPVLRERIAGAAVRLAKGVRYTSAGTVEFLLGPDGEFFFLEMNTRIQVEHPVTEMITGVDLVREQLRVAAGEPLSVTQADVAARGHAIEIRIYAEDALRNFLPSIGTLTAFAPPLGPGVRVDSGVREGSAVTIYYDPMVAKVIAWDRDRPAAIARLSRALGEMRVEGVKTTRELGLFILGLDAFQRGQVSTRALETDWMAKFKEAAHT
ncbi:MAG: acetyl-CoA carboxylase biotin carboxylase subunit [Armatimonadetes bacterium]|nr:acetyl-CoA carboxylase biotin carboxylase subunit [Armatimonadota bacterium]